MSTHASTDDCRVGGSLIGLEEGTREQGKRITHPAYMREMTLATYKANQSITTHALIKDYDDDKDGTYVQMIMRIYRPKRILSQ